MSLLPHPVYRLCMCGGTLVSLLRAQEEAIVLQVLQYFTPALVLPRQIDVCVCACTSAGGRTAAGSLSVILLVD